MYPKMFCSTCWGVGALLVVTSAEIPPDSGSLLAMLHHVVTFVFFVYF